MKFRPSLLVEEFIETIHARVGARNKAVLGRAGLFIALGQGIPPEFKPKDSQGKDLDDDTVIGEDLRDVVRAALNYRAGNDLDEQTYRQEFRRYFEYGCLCLKQIWEESANDQTQFVSSLLKLIGEDFIEPKDFSGKQRHPMKIVNEPVQLNLLENEEPWTINEAGNNGLLIISGKPGTGKSQLALDLLAQVAKQGLRFVFFDLKGELEDDPTNQLQRENRKRFFELTGAKYIRLIDQDLPINPLLHDTNPAMNAQIAFEIASLIRAFVPQLGAKQERTIADAYQSLLQPDFIRLVQELDNRGASGVDIAIPQKIVDLNIFASALSSESPEKFLGNSLVIDFKKLGNDNDSKSLIVALILNFLMNQLNKNLPVENGIQPLKMILFVDEAHLILPKDGKAGLLSKLARQGRSWGFPLWLASQDADSFVTTGTNATNFADLATCGIHFSPDTLKGNKQKQVFGRSINQLLKSGEAILRLKNNIVIGIARQFWKYFLSK